MVLHWALKERIEQHYAGELAHGLELKQDALVIGLDNGTALEVRYVDGGEYSFRWLWGEAELAIDTAPVHGGLGTYPHHLHGPDGELLPDPITSPERDPWENVRAVLDAVIRDPLLGLGA